VSVAAASPAAANSKQVVIITDPPYCLLTRRRKGGDLRDAKPGVKNDPHFSPSQRFETVADYRTFTRAWLSTALAALPPASPSSAPSAPLVVWTNFLGRAPICEVAGELGYTQLFGEYLWAKLPSAPATTTTAPIAPGVRHSLIGAAGKDLALRVYECALILYHRSAALPALQPACDQPPRVWTVTTPYMEPATHVASKSRPSPSASSGLAEDELQWRSHPNHKPFAVLDPLIRQYTQPNDLVLDPFAGSGSIGAAALRLQRRSVNIELDPVWAQCVSRRLQHAASHK
jgi:site-specific DNA-methyltransferase (adenine-specific)